MGPCQMKKIKIEFSSNLNYEGMVVYISIGNQELALLNYDKGAENIEFEFLPLPSRQDKLELPLDELIAALKRAKEILLKCAEEDKYPQAP